MPDTVPSLTEFDWVTTQYGEVLHHLASVDDVGEFDDSCCGMGTTSCGIHSYVMIPGLFSRMGRMRCIKCCNAVGYPQGKGSPKNDDTCRPLVFARLGLTEDI